MNSKNINYESEPIGHWDTHTFDEFLLWASQLGVSDITLLPNAPLWIRLDGKWEKSTRRELSSSEIMTLLDIMARDSTASARLSGGEDVDFAYEIKINKIERIRFRVNATACKDGWSQGCSLVMRAIPSLPPKLNDLGLEPEIRKAVFPNNGLVLITGVMGTGKSTLLASILREIRETQQRNVITYEAPVEFDLMSIPNAKGPLVQTEIPLHLTNFKRTPKNAARRAADVLLYGESRDQETLRGMMEGAEIGVCAYSTVHTRNVSETPSRIINVFPEESQNQIATTLISSLRLIVQQRLLPSTKGGRCAIKEWLVFDAKIREALFKVPIFNLIPTIKDMVDKYGQSLTKSAKIAFEKNLITRYDYEVIKNEQEGGL